MLADGSGRCCEGFDVRCDRVSMIERGDDCCYYWGWVMLGGDVIMGVGGDVGG